MINATHVTTQRNIWESILTSPDVLVLVMIMTITMQLIFKELMGDHHLPGFLTTTPPSQQALPFTAWSEYMFVFMLGNSVRARLDAVTGSFWSILPLPNFHHRGQWPLLILCGLLRVLSLRFQCRILWDFWPKESLFCPQSPFPSASPSSLTIGYVSRNTDRTMLICFTSTPFL